MARNFSLDNRVWASNGDRTDPDTVTTSEANLLNVADGHIDSQGPFSDIMNWEQFRVSQMLNAIEQSGLMDWSSKTQYGERGLCLADNGQIYQSRKANNKNHPLSDSGWWIEYYPTGMGNMLTSVYDIDGNGVVDKASAIDGINASGNDTYYGKNASGAIGFHAIPPDGDMKKSLYDTDNNGRVDNADAVFGINTAGAGKYYGTDQNGTAGYFDLPADGDMLKTIYDTTNTGRVDVAESLFGINTALALSYYGKDKDGNTGFFEFIPQLPEYATRWPTAVEAGALPVGDRAVNSARLNDQLPDINPTADTVAIRDSDGDISARLFRSNDANQSSAKSGAGICFRNDDGSDNFMRFVSKDGLKTWLGYTNVDVGLNNIYNYPISHIASENAKSKQKYASEYAVGIAWKLAKQAYENTLIGGKVDNAVAADKLSVSRIIALNGDVVGSVNFDGSQNVNMSTTVADNSHKHVWDNITEAPIQTTRWPTPAEVGIRTNAENDQRFLGKTDKAADSELLDGIDISRIPYGSNGSAATAMIDFNDNTKSGFIEGNAAANQPGRDWAWGWQSKFTGGAKYGAQNVISQDGRMYFRVQAADGSGGWRAVYDTYNKPTAADVGALPLGGGTLTGSLTINNNAPTVLFQDKDGKSAFAHVNGNTFHILRSGGNNGTTWDRGPNGRQPMMLNLSNGDVTFSGNVIGYSDRTLKTNIKPIVNALSKVNQLNGVTFDWINNKDNPARQTGLIAQDLEKVLPEAVSKDENGKLMIAKGSEVGLLVEAIKELSAKVEKLEAN